MEPEDIEQRDFMVSLRGYDRDEVDAFKREVTEEIRSLKQALEQKPAETSGPARSEAPAPAPAVDRSAALQHVGEQTSKILLAAEQAAEQIRVEAEAAAEKLSDETARTTSELKERTKREVAELVADARRAADAIEQQGQAAKAAAEEDLKRVQEARRALTTQLEDVRRRLDETMVRLQASFEPQQSASSTPTSPLTKTPNKSTQQARLRTVPQPPRPEPQIKKEPEPETKVVTPEPGPELAAGKTEVPSAAPGQPVAEKVAEAEVVLELPEVVLEPEVILEPEVVLEPEGATKPETVVDEPETAKADEHAPNDSRAETATQAETEAEPQPEAAQTSGAPALQRLLQDIKREREEGKKEVENALAQVTALPTPEVETAPAQLDLIDTHDPFAVRASALGESPDTAARRMKRLLQEDHNDLLDRLRTHRGKGKVEDNLVSEDDHYKRFSGGLGEILQSAFVGGRSHAGGDGEGSAARAVESLIKRQLVLPLRTDLTKVIESGLEAQDTATAIAERASDVYRVWKGIRTEMLGEGLVYAAYHQGLLEAWNSKGAAQKRWILATDEAECPRDTCKANAEAGSLSVKATFPSGHLAPPAHGGCTCTLSGPEG
ncbi:MAG: DivIVA domain-containing protein [Actinomycetota bacterium]